MADGDIVRYNEIKRMDAIREFWQYFDFWREKQKLKIKQARNNIKKP